MGRHFSLGCIILILFLQGAGTGNQWPGAVESSTISVENLHEQEMTPGGNHITAYPLADGSYKGQLAPSETDIGRIFHPKTSFTSPIISLCGVLGSLNTTLYRTELIIPRLNNRTLIFPFHSFF